MAKFIIIKFERGDVQEDLEVIGETDKQEQIVLNQIQKFLQKQQYMNLIF